MTRRITNMPKPDPRVKELLGDKLTGYLEAKPPADSVSVFINSGSRIGELERVDFKGKNLQFVTDKMVPNPNGTSGQLFYRTGELVIQTSDNRRIALFSEGNWAYVVDNSNG